MNRSACREENDRASTIRSLAYTCLKFPECGWIAVNNVPSAVVRRDVHDVTVEVEYYWINPGADGWLIARSNGPGGAEQWKGNDINTHKEYFRANQWAVWNLRLQDAWFGTRQDGTDVLILFGADPVDECYIRSVKVYETARPEVYAVFGATELHSGVKPASLELNTRYRDRSFFVFDPDAAHALRWNGGVEIICAQSDGVLTVDGRSYSYGAGDILFINPDQVRGKGTADGACYFLTFDPAMLETDRHNSVAANIRGGRRRFATRVPAGHPANAPLQELCRQLIAAHSSPSEYKEVKIRSLLLELLYECCERGLIVDTPQGEDKRRMEYIRRALEYMQEHLAEPVTVGQIAAHVHLSEAHFAHQFKACIGDTPLRRMNRMRLQMAADLLLQGSTVTVAAIEAGIPNVGHFIRQFKRAYGDTPYRWQKNQRK